MVYAIINEENVIVNLIEYDGIQEYDPGEGLSLVLALDGDSIGDVVE